MSKIWWFPGNYLCSHFSWFGWRPANWISINWFFPTDILHLISCFWPSNWIFLIQSFLCMLWYYLWNYGFRYMSYLIYMFYQSFWKIDFSFNGTFDIVLGWITDWGGLSVICMIGLLPGNNFLLVWFIIWWRNRIS